MILGEPKDLMIGTLTAYYDPDMQKSNNPFCAIGFGSPVILRYLDGTYFRNLDNSLFAIDSDTLAVTLINFEAPVGVAGDLIQLKAEFPSDSRVDPAITPSPTSFFALMPTIKLWDYCDTSSLGNGMVTLLDG